MFRAPPEYPMREGLKLIKKLSYREVAGNSKAILDQLWFKFIMSSSFSVRIVSK